jgi:hypothetical protein
MYLHSRGMMPGALFFFPAFLINLHFKIAQNKTFKTHVTV